MLNKVLAALYGENDLRAVSRVSRHAQITSCLRKKLPDDDSIGWHDVIEVLQKNNYFQEALYLSDKNQQDRGHRLIGEGQVITSVCDSYPQILVSNMGASAPPLLWISNPALRDAPPWLNPDGSQRVCVAAIGCRTPLNVGLIVSQKVGEWTANRSFLAISGGANGCDEAYGNSALHHNGQVIHILPHGMNKMSRDIFGYAMTVCPPNEPFSTARAMERNNLIFAMAHMSVVCSARYRIGGSWQGAVTALKAKRAVVVADWTSTGFAATQTKHAEGTYGLAQRALRNLGAFPLTMELESIKKNIDDKLDAALDWSFEQYAGTISTGLFAS